MNDGVGIFLSLISLLHEAYVWWYQCRALSKLLLEENIHSLKAERKAKLPLNSGCSNTYWWLFFDGFVCLFLAVLCLRGHVGFPLQRVRMTLWLQQLGSRGGGSSCCRPGLEHRPSSCGPRASFPRGTWGLPRSGIKPPSSALSGGVFTTEPPGKPLLVIILFLHKKKVGKAIPGLISLLAS